MIRAPRRGQPTMPNQPYHRVRALGPGEEQLTRKLDELTADFLEIGWVAQRPPTEGWQDRIENKEVNTRGVTPGQGHKLLERLRLDGKNKSV